MLPSGYRIKHEIVAIPGVPDLAIRSLLDRQEFSDPDGAADREGISSALWSLFGVVWGLALLGIVQEIWFAKGARILSLVIYLLMGWVALVAVVPLIQALSWSGFAWLAAGGAVYTAGIVFYLYDERFTHFHGIWHLFVLAGSAVHYAAIVLYVA